MKLILALVLTIPIYSQQTVIIADSITLGQQFRRWQPWLPIIGIAKWADGSVITDPATDVMTKNQKRLARLALWQPILTAYTNTQLKTLGYEAFYAAALPCRNIIELKIKSAMGNPSATVAEMKTYVESQFALVDLDKKAPDWTDNRNCTMDGLHLGNPSVGITSTFGTSVTAIAWSHNFDDSQITWLEALIRAKAQETHFKLTDKLPEDWTGVP